MTTDPLMLWHAPTRARLDPLALGPAKADLVRTVWLTPDAHQLGALAWRHGLAPPAPPVSLLRSKRRILAALLGRADICLGRRPRAHARTVFALQAPSDAPTLLFCGRRCYVGTIGGVALQQDDSRAGSQQLEHLRRQLRAGGAT